MDGVLREQKWSNRYIPKEKYRRRKEFCSVSQLNNSTAGILTKLQLDTSENGQLVYVVWENYNPAEDKRNVWVSSSLDAGKTFKTYRLNIPSDGNGYEPALKVIDDDILIVWTQDPQCIALVHTVIIIHNQ